MKKKCKFKTILFLFLLMIFIVPLGRLRKTDIVSSKRKNLMEKINHPLIKASNADAPREIDWDLTWGGYGNDVAADIATDSEDNVYMTGYTESYGAGGKKAYLAKYDPLGNLLWDLTWGASADEISSGVAVDNEDNVYITGYTESYGAGANDAFLAKYSSAGICQWELFWGGANDDKAFDIGVDSANFIYITGETASYGSGGKDTFLVKYNSSGDLQDSHYWGSTSDETANGLAIDGSNNIYITGKTDSWGTNGEAFLVKYNCSMSLKRFSIWGGSNLDSAYNVDVDSENNIYITGYSESYGFQSIFLVKYNSTLAKKWDTLWGGPNIDYAYDIAVDGSDNIYISGWTTGYGAVNDDSILLKYDGSGKYLWNITWGCDNTERGNSVVVDKSDNIYISGWTYDSSDYEAFLVKYGSEADWDIKWGGINQDLGEDVAIDGENNIYMTGWTFSYGAGSYQKAILTKYDSSGTLLWDRIWGGNLGDVARGVAVDSENNVYMTGATANFGATGVDAFLVKYDSAGNFLWNTTWSSSSYDEAYDIAVDSSDNIYITGNIEDPTFNKQTFLAKFNSSGEFLRASTFGYTGDDFARAVAIDNHDNIYITGYTEFYGPGGKDALLIKYNSSLSPSWTFPKFWGGIDDDESYGITLDESDNIYITGYSNTTRDGGDDMDVFLAKYTEFGFQQWNTTWGGSTDEIAFDLATDSSDNIYLTGATGGFGTVGGDVIIHKYDSSGTLKWNTTWGGNNQELGYGIAVTGSTDIYSTGMFSNDDTSYAFLVKYSFDDTSGNNVNENDEDPTPDEETTDESTNDDEDSGGIPGFNILLILGVSSVTLLIYGKKIKSLNE